MKRIIINSVFCLGEIVMEESSMVGTVVAVLIVLAILVTALGVYVAKHRRLRHRFQVSSLIPFALKTKLNTDIDIQLGATSKKGSFCWCAQ